MNNELTIEYILWTAAFSLVSTIIVAICWASIKKVASWSWSVTKSAWGLFCAPWRYLCRKLFTGKEPETNSLYQNRPATKLPENEGGFTIGYREPFRALTDDDKLELHVSRIAEDPEDTYDGEIGTLKAIKFVTPEFKLYPMEKIKKPAPLCTHELIMKELTKEMLNETRPRMIQECFKPHLKVPSITDIDATP